MFTNEQQVDRVRIGNDLGLCWLITRTDGVNVPLCDAANLQVLLVNQRNRTIVSPAYTVDNNTITLQFPASQQKSTGVYNAVLTFQMPDGNGYSTHTVDKEGAFELVDSTSKECTTEGGGLVVISLESSMASALKGDSAYKIALKNGFEGSETEWLESLKKPSVDAANLALDATKKALDAASSALQAGTDAIQSVNDLSAEVDTKLENVSVDLTEYQTTAQADGKYAQKDGTKVLSSNDFTDDYKDKIDSALQSIPSDVVRNGQIYTKEEIDSKVLSSKAIIQEEEQEVGVFKYGGKQYTVYESTVGVKGYSSGDIVISNDPLGDNLYLNVTCMTANINGRYLVSDIYVKDMYVDSDMRTVATVVNNTDNTEINLIITFRYIKGAVSYTNFSVSFPVQDGMGISSAALPVLKFNKDFAVIWSQDDAMLDIYNKFFKYANGRWVDYARNYHEYNGKKGTDGEQPDRVLTYTDGAANRRVYTFDSAFVTYLNSSKSDGIHYEDKYPYPYISWKELQKFFDFNNSVTNHGGGNSSAGYERESIVENAESISSKIGFTPFIMANPGEGNQDNYFAEALKLDFIYYHRTKDTPLQSLDYMTKENILTKKGKFGRLFTDNLPDKTSNGLISYIKQCETREDHPLVYIASHGCYSANDSNYATGFNWESARDMYDYIFDNCNDRALVCGASELFEWLFARVYSKVSYSVSGGVATVDMKVARMPNMYQDDISVMIEGTSAFTEVPSITFDGIDVTKDSASVIDGKLMINVNYSPRWKALAEKYTAVYESTVTDDAKYDAMYMCNMLNDNLKKPFIDRINAVVTEPPVPGYPPSLSWLDINNGDGTTQDQDVTVVFNYEGTVTEYKISEIQDFSDTSYKAWSSDTISYRLSSGYGMKKLYAQLKNVHGESSVVSASIEYKETTGPEPEPSPAKKYTVTAVSVNTDYGTVSPELTEVEEGGSVTITATANSGYVISSWNIAEGTGVDASTGTVILTGISEDIEITCSFKAATPPPSDNLTILMVNKETGTTYDTLNDGKTLNVIFCNGWASTTAKSIKNTKGASVATMAYDKTEEFKSTATYSGNPVLTGDLGIIPDSYLQMYALMNSNKIAPEGITRTFSGLPSGDYRFSIMLSVNSTISAKVKQNVSYVVNGVTATVPADMNIENNSTEWIEIDTVVGEDGILEFKTCQKTQWQYVGFNALKIEKIS